jgi:hypothetical protein
MSDKEQIQDTIQTYFDSMYESSADKAHAAFHPNAKITGYLEDGLHEMSVDDLLPVNNPRQRRKGSRPDSTSCR